jgi:hypothetical protein
METIKFSLVPLRQASLCLDCDMISAAHTHCAACGSVALLNLARTLDGKGFGDVTPRPMVVAHISARSAYKPVSVSSVRPRQHRPAVGECLPFPKADNRHPTEAGNAHRWYSLRDVAAIVHRAMTMVLFAVLVRGSALTTPADRESRERSTASEQGQTFNMQKESCRM